MADLAYGKVYTMTREKARMLLVQEYLQTGSFSKAAKTWHTSRRIVRKWHRRYLEEGLEGLQDRSHRPHTMPRKTSEEVEAEVLEARKQTGYGRHRRGSKPSHLLAQGERDHHIGKLHSPHPPPQTWTTATETSQAALSGHVGLGTGRTLLSCPDGRKRRT